MAGGGAVLPGKCQARGVGGGDGEAAEGGKDTQVG